MNITEDESPLCKAFQDGAIDTLLNEYISTCLFQNDEIQSNEKKSNKQKENGYRRFPNIAGFCRYLGTGTDELIELSARFPREADRLRATLEDEALNASPSPTVIAAYFKKRLGYEKEAPRVDSGIPEIHFEHDIWEDGE
jgi:hypothetical protein